MSKLIINSHEEFEKYVGQELGISDWLEVDQQRICNFADATLDHQWIHTDPERAKTDSPFGQTIVHGYLTLSLLPYLWQQIIEVNNLKMMGKGQEFATLFGINSFTCRLNRLVGICHMLGKKG